MVAVANRVRPDVNMTPSGVVATIRSLRVAIQEGRATAAKGEVKHLARLTSLLNEQGFGYLLD
jgi:hypothetical protein